MALEQDRQRLARQVAILLPAFDGLSSQADGTLLDALEILGAARRSIDALGAELADEVTRRCDQGALAARQGEKSAAAIVAARAGIDLGEAQLWCDAGSATVPRASIFGEQLEPRRPELSRAFATGELSVEAVARIARSLDEIERRSPKHVDAAEELLTRQAAVLTSRQLRVACRSIIDTVDSEGVELREEELRRRSGLDVSHTPDGLIRWVVTMHPEAAGFLSAALDARTAPRREPRFADPGGVAFEREAPEEVETRTLAQRRLDALVSIARESLQHDPGHVAGTAVTMLVTVPLGVLRDGLGAARISGVDVRIGAGTARRLAAEAEIIPVVLGGDSEPLDLGRSQRLFSAAQRRVLDIRDGGCLWPKCTAPPGWCEAAHVDPWATGGNTDLRNAILLCPYHHRRFDLDGWRLETRAGERYLVPPSWVDARRRPRMIGRTDLAA